jgi:glutamine synthetase
MGRQCEVVLKYAPALEAADNELLARQVIEDVCSRHGFRALIGSKSFTESSRGEGINGSGKHTNLSLVRYQRETGEALENLLKLEEFRDGSSSTVNLFGLILLAAIGRHWEVFDSALASRGNDLRRVPGFEAPVYLSAFLGSTAEFRDSLSQDRNRSVSLGLSGDKLEWRTPGANTPMHYPLAFLTMAIIEVVRETCRRVEQGLKDGRKRKDLVLAEARRLREEINYFVVDEDVFEIPPDEARTRFGKRIVHNTPEALEALRDLEGIKFLLHDDVFTREMIDSFSAVQMENYAARVIAEAQVLASIAKVLSNRVFRSPLMQIRPKDLDRVEQCLRLRQQYLGKLNAELLKKIDSFCVEGGECDGCEDLMRVLDQARKAPSIEDQARLCVDRILPLMKEVRRIYEDIEEILGGAEEANRL